MDAAEERINAIHAALDAATGTAVPFAIVSGRKPKHTEHAKTPRYVWIPQRSGFDTPEETSTVSIDIVRYTVRIWFDTVENCRRAMWALMAAATQVSASRVRFVEYDPMPTPAQHEKLGEVFHLTIELRLDIPTEITGPLAPIEVEVQAHEHTVTVFDAVIC